MDRNYVAIDGYKHLMVAQELVMTLFGILYVYPHVPSRLIDDKKTTVWYSIGSKDALRTAISNLLQASPVIRASLAPDVTIASVTWVTVCDPERLDRALDLHLYHDDVPITSQQMFHTITEIYRIIANAEDISTREYMQLLFQQCQLLPPSFRLPADRSDRSGLLRFCSKQTNEWTQQYLASAPLFFYPEGLLGSCQRRGGTTTVR